MCISPLLNVLKGIQIQGKVFITFVTVEQKALLHAHRAINYPVKMYYVSLVKKH